MALPMAYYAKANIKLDKLFFGVLLHNLNKCYYAQWQASNVNIPTLNPVEFISEVRW
jgi:hypothetical protein